MKIKFLIVFLLLISTVSYAETVLKTTENTPLQKSNSDARVIALIPANTTLEKKWTTDKFYNVTFNGTDGWIAKAYTVEGKKEIEEASKVPSITYIPGVNESSIVKTDMANALPAVNEEQLKHMISNYCKGATRTRLLTFTNYFVKMQETYKVNAVFAVAASIAESSGGVNGKLINTYHSYNLFSIKGTNNGKYVTFKSQKWKKYSGFEEAIMDFGRLIANGPHYFTKGKYTPISIGKTYCNARWAITVAKTMNSMYKTLAN